MGQLQKLFLWGPWVWPTCRNQMVREQVCNDMREQHPWATMTQHSRPPSPWRELSVPQQQKKELPPRCGGLGRTSLTRPQPPALESALPLPAEARAWRSSAVLLKATRRASTHADREHAWTASGTSVFPNTGCPWPPLASSCKCSLTVAFHRLHCSPKLPGCQRLGLKLH